ncbi:MAG: GntR family transcriptional regulator [Holophagaceae bacterium]|nr:GntR family transcriptional regulator [Holophagaceae bacterium]
MEFSPIKTKRLYEEIVEQIKQLITEGRLKPGDRLLAERNLPSSSRSAAPPSEKPSEP